MPNQLPKLRDHVVSYQGAFDVLDGDLHRLCEYIEPVDDNLSAYSHRTFELLLRSCTEWESMCKDLIVASGVTKDPSTMNVNDYAQLENMFSFSAAEVGLMFWRPAPVWLRPYRDWTTAKPPLAWYAGYNSVKHNRNMKFNQATFDNVRHSMAALFLIHAALNLIPFVSGMSHKDIGSHIETRYPNEWFAVRMPK